MMAVMLSGCFLLPKEAEAPELPLVTPYSGPEYSEVETVRGEVISEARISFTFNPTRREDLRFSVVGRSYGGIFVSEGSQVRAGDLLAELDCSSIQEEIRSTETEIKRLRVRLSAAYRALELAQEKETLQGGFSTVSSDARRADAAYYENSIAIQQKKLEEKQAELETFRLYAPFDGTVTYVKPVDELSRSGKADTVVTVTDTGSSVFTALTEHWALFPEGEQFTVSTEKGDYLCAACDPASYGVSTAEAADGQKYVCLEICEGSIPEGSLRGEVRIELEKKENVLLLPVKAVFTAGGRSYVYYENESGLRSAREVVCGLSDGSYIEIISGLEEGDHVILS